MLRHAIRRVVLNGERDEREAMKRVGHRARSAMRGIVERQQADLIEVQRRASGFRGVEVAKVNRIERAAEYPDAARWRSCVSSRARRCEQVDPLRFRLHVQFSLHVAGACTGNLAPGRLQQLLEVRHLLTPEMGISGSLRARTWCRQSLRGRPDRRAHRSCSRRRSAVCAATCGSKSRSSSWIVSKSSTGSRPDAPETSTRCTSTLVRST